MGNNVEVRRAIIKALTNKFISTGKPSNQPEKDTYNNPISGTAMNTAITQ